MRPELAPLRPVSFTRPTHRESSRNYRTIRIRLPRCMFDSRDNNRARRPPTSTAPSARRGGPRRVHRLVALDPALDHGAGEFEERNRGAGDPEEFFPADDGPVARLPAEGGEAFGDDVPAFVRRGAGGEGEEHEVSGLPLDGLVRQWQPVEKVCPQPTCIACRRGAEIGANQFALVFAHQSEGLGVFAEQVDRPLIRLAVAGGGPVVEARQFPPHLRHHGRWQVARLGQCDAVGTDAVQEHRRWNVAASIVSWMSPSRSVRWARSRSEKTCGAA